VTDDPDDVSDVENQVAFTYDDLGRVKKSEQDHDSEVDKASTLATEEVLYTFDPDADGGSIFNDGARLKKVTYPNGREMFYDYGADYTYHEEQSNDGDGGIGDLLHRPTKIYELNSNAFVLADYNWAGVGRLVRYDVHKVDSNDPPLRYNLAHGTGGAYDGLDRFGRIRDLRWTNYGGGTDHARFQYGHDYAGNRIWRDDPVAATAAGSNSDGDHFDELYAYDGLHRLTTLDRGDANSGHTALVTDPADTTSFSEAWGLDGLGNWTEFEQDDDGDGTLEVDQGRDHTKANEIESIDDAQTHVDHDAAGNMTKVPKPSSWADHYDLTYDAWQRLVKVVDGTTIIAEYRYDALGRRIAKMTDYTGETPGETRHFYYNTSYQVLEERVDTATTADRQFVWGVRYVDDLILRDRQTDDNASTGDWGKWLSGLDERMLAMQDGNFNVVALMQASTGSSGTMRERYAYAAYGEPLPLETDFDRKSGGTIGYEWEYLYTGREYDVETGMYQFRHRYYHAQLARFNSRDPIGYDAEDANLYRYVQNAPTNALDPIGLVGRMIDSGSYEDFAEASSFLAGATGVEVNYSWRLTFEEDASVQVMSVLINNCASAEATKTTVSLSHKVGTYRESSSSESESRSESTSAGVGDILGLGMKGEFKVTAERTITEQHGMTLGESDEKSVGFDHVVEVGACACAKVVVEQKYDEYVYSGTGYRTVAWSGYWWAFPSGGVHPSGQRTWIQRDRAVERIWKNDYEVKTIAGACTEDNECVFGQ